MKILVDGYNLIFAWGWMPSNRSPHTSEVARAKLFQKLSQLIPASIRSQVTIVFDVKSPSNSNASHRLESGLDRSGFRVLFSHEYPDADALIEDLIRKEIAPKRLVVVSTDQRLRTAAQRRQAVSIRSEEFLDVVGDLVHQCLPAEADSNRELHGQTPSTPGLAGGKQSAISDLKDIDWLAEFGMDPVENVDQASQNQTEDRPPEIALDELVDVRWKKLK